MKKIFIVVLVLFLSACTKVPSGNKGVVVHLLGSSKGVDSEEVGVGRYWLGLNDELYLFPVYTQNDTWAYTDKLDQSIMFQTTEGLSVNSDIGISYHINPDKVSLVFQKYRKGIEEISDVYLRNMVRDSLNRESSSKGVEYIYGQGKSELLERVEAKLRAEVSPIGIEIEHLYWIGALRLPQTVIDAINDKIGATQKAIRVQNEIEQVRAESEKLKLKSEAEAKANELLSKSITTNLIELKKIELQLQSIQKWNGQLPMTMIPGSSLPFVGTK
jgi:regulator of protease activity HflC (stomatin/prohibitin superfamily)